MKDQIPIHESSHPTSEQQQIDTLFREIERQQLDFLDQAGKRIVGLSATLIGIVFGVITLGDIFPPPYMQSDVNKVLAVGALAGYLIAMIASMWAVEPQTYKLRRYSPTDQRRVLNEMLEYKSRSLRLAGLLFLTGSVCLAVLTVAIIFDV